MTKRSAAPEPEPEPAPKAESSGGGTLTQEQIEAMLAGDDDEEAEEDDETELKAEMERQEAVSRLEASQTGKMSKEQIAALLDDEEETEDRIYTDDIDDSVIVKKLKAGYLKDAGVPEDFIILKANNQNIRSAADMETAFRAAQGSDEQTLWIWGKTPAGRAMSFAVYLGE
jgi:hypothetical protein